MRRIGWITLSLIAVVAWMGGCTTVPTHKDAWLSFKYQIHCGNYHDCKELTNQAEAINYYKSIGVVDPTTYTLNQWLSDNGFVPGAPVVRGVYANLGDLQIGRDMNCLPSGTRVACYVNNHGPVPSLVLSNWPDIKQALADADGTSGKNPFATVAMVYDSSVSGPNNVTFYAFNGPDSPPGALVPPGGLLTLVILDGAGAILLDDDDEPGPKTVPRMCMACHGGVYDKNTHSVSGASFLPFDVFYFRYSGKEGFTFDDQAESFRKLNAIVASTKATPAIQELINGMYPAGVTKLNSVAVDGFTPAGWADNPSLYQGVVRQYCRMCHIAQPESFTSSSDFVGFKNQIQHEVCETKDMPHAQVPFGVEGTKIGFWHDIVAQHDLGNFLQSQGINSCLPHD